MDLDFVELWSSMNNLVRGVVVVLTLQAVACIAVVVDRMIMLVRAQRADARFRSALQSAVTAGDISAAETAAKSSKGSLFASMLTPVLSSILKLEELGHHGTRLFQLVSRERERALDRSAEQLHRGMNVIASTGSTAPFIGLLGTVLGILNAFKLIAADGSGGMGTIGAAIGEALIVTGYGLTVAIPSVLLFNWLSSKLSAYESRLDADSAELVDTLDALALQRTSDSAEADAIIAPRESMRVPAGSLNPARLNPEQLGSDSLKPEQLSAVAEA